MVVMRGIKSFVSVVRLCVVMTNCLSRLQVFVFARISMHRFHPQVNDKTKAKTFFLISRFVFLRNENKA